MMTRREGGQATFSAAQGKQLFYTHTVRKENLPEAELIVNRLRKVVLEKSARVLGRNRMIQGVL
jgi:hypothetical protein